jgi:hypothetical protein
MAVALSSQLNILNESPINISTTSFLNILLNHIFSARYFIHQTIKEFINNNHHPINQNGIQNLITLYADLRFADAS